MKGIITSFVRSGSVWQVSRLAATLKFQLSAGACAASEGGIVCVAVQTYTYSAARVLTAKQDMMRNLLPPLMI
eukprot:5001722-Ditylum_brightwellii.AAC.1